MFHNIKNVQANFNIKKQSVQRRLCIGDVQWMTGCSLGLNMSTKKLPFIHAQFGVSMDIFNLSSFINQSNLCIAKVYVHLKLTCIATIILIWKYYFGYFSTLAKTKLDDPRKMLFFLSKKNISKILQNNFPSSRSFFYPLPTI